MRIRPTAGALTAALAAFVAFGVSIAVGHPSARPAVNGQPTPIKPIAHGALSECPNPDGLQPFDTTTTGRAKTDVLDYGQVSLSLDIAHSDQAWQPEVRAMWKSIYRPAGPEPKAKAAMEVTSAKRSPYRPVVAHSCGKSLVDDSLAVTAGPKTKPQCIACQSTFFFVDRRGRAQLYYIY